jgi:glycosyltransferase involved in cell wall biosynthesis
MAEQYSAVPNVVVYPFMNPKYLKSNADMTSKNIIFTGRMVKAKGIELMISSFLKTSKKHRDKLYLVGKIEDKIKELKVPHKDIIVTGWVNNVEDYLKNSSIFINLATHESFGVSILEAMAAGVIPLITKNCGIKELVEPISKELICKRNSNEVSCKIKWINSDKKRKKKISQECKKIASKFNKNSSINSFKKALNILCRQMNRP